jgi:hypothetical protein
MHIITLLLHIASFQLLANAIVNPSDPPNPWETPSSAIWATPIDENKKPYFFETDFKKATGYTADSMAKALRSRFGRCFKNNDIDGPLKLVLSPTDLGRDFPTKASVMGFRNAIDRAVFPQGMHTLQEIGKLCEMNQLEYIPNDAVRKLRKIAASTQPSPMSQMDVTTVRMALYNFLAWTFDKCMTMAWGMLAEQGSIAIEPPMIKADYLGMLYGLKDGLRIPVYTMDKNQINAHIPKYTRTKDLLYTHKE